MEVGLNRKYESIPSFFSNHPDADSSEEESWGVEGMEKDFSHR